MPRRLSLCVLLLALLLCVAGCQAPVGTARPGPTGAPPQDRRLSAADARLYRGDYEGAEAAYRALLSDGVTGAAAHLSTLLAYENRFDEAVTQGRAGVASHADSESLARLTRALDWAQDVDEAVATGARAVATRPVSPLAHVFYSEALADAGRFDDAARELRSAEDAGGDAFIQGEVYREWANYYRGRKDSQSELNFSELAVKAQPAFPERQLDMVRFDYGNQRPVVARTVADKLLAAHPHDYRLLIAAADAALSGGDGQRAPQFYRAAAQASPDAPEAALGLAELDVAISQDFKGAHDRLLDALRRSPTSGPVYQYVRYLDLLVLKTDPAADLAPIAPQPPPDVAAGRVAAIQQINGRRQALGLPALQEDPALVEAAQAHAYYFLFNIGHQQVGGETVYGEDPSLPAFTGATALDRARHLGYTGARTEEAIDHSSTPAASVEDWTGSVFHRFPLVDPESETIGYGFARVGPLAIAVMDVGLRPGGAAEPVRYPTANQTGVPAGFVDDEVPDPLPQGAFSPAGFPVSLQVGGAQRLVVTEGRLLDAEGLEVPSYTLAPGDRLAPGRWALVPKRPLKPGARYTAVVSGTVDGAAISQRWSFTAVTP